MRGFRYSKEGFEVTLYKKIRNTEALGHKIQLLKKHNELLVKFNRKLIEEFSV